MISMAIVKKDPFDASKAWEKNVYREKIEQFLLNPKT